MDVLRKVVKKGPKSQKQAIEKNSKSNHEKLEENWTDTPEPVKDGITFYAKYIGSTLVQELEEGQSYGDSICQKAVSNIVDMAKMRRKSLAKVSVVVSTQGIEVTDIEKQHTVMLAHSIFRICFCTVDRNHDKIFGYIARNTENETIECYAFLCLKKKIAESMALTVAQTFSLAQQKQKECIASKNEKKEECERLSQRLSILNLREKYSTKEDNTDESGDEDDIQQTCQESTKENTTENLINSTNFDDEDEFSSLALSRHLKDKADENSLSHQFFNCQ